MQYISCNILALQCSSRISVCAVQAPGGNSYPGLVIIDGVTVTLPLLTALSTGLVDVPLILTTMHDVCDNIVFYDVFMIQAHVYLSRHA